MVSKTFIYKIPNGKMLRVIAELEGERIEKINITGDFFIHPEESIMEIEKSIIECNKQTDENELVEKIETAINVTGARLIGVDAKSIAFAVRNALVSE
ncbi:MAG: hypothetical protein ABH842_01030 [Candidatus Micrarchaeota archaeon]